MSSDRPRPSPPVPELHRKKRIVPDLASPDWTRGGGILAAQCQRSAPRIRNALRRIELVLGNTGPATGWFARMNRRSDLTT